jgi:polysaccharide deacetylase family protein (PEP-CTERM system associated)
VARHDYTVDVLFVDTPHDARYHYSKRFDIQLSYRLSEQAKRRQQRRGTETTVHRGESTVAERLTLLNYEYVTTSHRSGRHQLHISPKQAPLIQYDLLRLIITVIILKLERNGMNIMQIDVEPWYCDLDMSMWDDYDENVVQYTREIMAMLEETDNKATFFVLSEVAQKYPELIQEIEERGYEVGSHGTRHVHLDELDRESFAEGIDTSIEALRSAGVDQVAGYRAPQFSLTIKSKYIIPELIKRDFLYDSSVFPVWTPLYGIPDAPRTPYRISESTLQNDPKSPLWEFPLSTYRLPVAGQNIPIAGGFYLRAMPYRLLHYFLRSSSIVPKICYLHPWELESDPEKVEEYPWFQYVGRSTTRRKIKSLFNDFSFTTTKDYLENNMGDR